MPVIVDPMAFLQEAMKNAFYGMAPTDFLNAALPYLTQGQVSATDQARIDAANRQAQMDADSRTGVANIQAGATTASAQADAGARIEAAKMALQGVNAQIAGDYKRAQMGDENAAKRLTAELGQQAQIQNQIMRMEVAKLASSTGLRDAAASRLFVEGMGEQPGIGSAFLAGPMQEITSPQVEYVGQKTAPARSGFSILTGDSSSGKRTGFEEVVTVDPNRNQLQVTPLAGRAAGGGTWDLDEPGNPIKTTMVPYPTDTKILPPGETLINGVMSRWDAALQKWVPNSTGILGRETIQRAEPTAFGMSSPNFGWPSPGATPGNAVAQRWNMRPRPGDIRSVGQAGDWRNRLGELSSLIRQALGVGQPGIQPVGPFRPTTTPASPLNAATGGPLASLANTPALVAMRTGQAPPAFREYGGPIDIGFGMGEIPAPAQGAATFGKLNPWYQEDALQAYEMAGIPRQLALSQMANATPGFRTTPGRAFTF